MSTGLDGRCLVLIGPMGAGKSSVGRRVARALRVPFRDTDTLIVREHGPIAALFAAQGEAAFRTIEEETVATALRSPAVVALGGGAVLSETTRERIADHRVVLLTVDEKAIAGRIRGGKRPLLASADDPVAAWRRIRDEREPIYRSIADEAFETSRGPLQGVVDRIVTWVRAAPGRIATEEA